MFTSIASLDSVLQCLLPVFTQPSFQTHVEVLLGWVMCLSKRTEYGVFQTIQADTPVSRKRAASLRPLLQLLQPLRLDRPRLGPSGLRGGGRPAQPAGAVVPGRRRHAAAQTGQARLRPWAGSATRWPRPPSGSPPPRATIGWSWDWRSAFPEPTKSTVCRFMPSCTCRAKGDPAKPRWPSKCSTTCWLGSRTERWFFSAMGRIRRKTCSET